MAKRAEQQGDRPHTHDTLWLRHQSKIKGLLIGATLTLVLTLIAAAIGYWVIVPDLAERTLRERLARLERDGDVTITTASISPDGLRGVRIERLVVSQPGSPLEPLLTVDEMSVGLDRARLLAGQRVIASLTLRGAHLHVTRDAQGQDNLTALVQSLRSTRSEDDPEKEDTQPTEAQDRDARMLRHFGGQWPNVDGRDVTISFTSQSAPFPLTSLTMSQVVLDSSGQNARLLTELKLIANPQAPEDISLPSSISTTGNLAIPFEQSALSFTFDTPLRISGLPPHPELVVGLSDLELSKGGTIRLTQLTLGDRRQPKPFFQTHAAELRLERFTTRASELRPLALLLDEPVLRVSFDAQGASSLDPLLDALRGTSPEARDATPKPEKDGDDDAPPPEDASSSADRLLASARSLDLNRLIQLMPERVDIQGARALIEDQRALAVTRPAQHLELRDATLTITRKSDSGLLSISGGFEARAGKDGTEDRGGATLKLTANIKTHLLRIEAEARQLDLSWVAQLAGPRAVEHLRGGALHATFDLQQTTLGAPFDFEGDISLQGLELFWPKLTEEPLKDWSLGYTFKGSFDPEATVPAAKLLKTALDANVPQTEPDPDGPKSRRVIRERPPERGALVLTRGSLRMGEMRAEVLPALYGLDPKKPLPARFDLSVKMGSTPIQSILDAMPQTLLGDIAGARIAGAVKMAFALEVPLYDASNMVWRGEPETSNVELIHLPAAVDVRKLPEAFTHYISDESVLYERRVRIPEMTLTPTQWLIDNAGLELEQVNVHWRRGDWFVPDERQDGSARDPQDYWLSPSARWRAPSKPWFEREDERIVRKWKPYKDGQTEPMVPEPYGPYQFVPISHIAPWLPRAILTTEDNSFFKHDGFNRLALRQSVERNLAEGDYARGASTISMQLIKNLYLTRKKVMARKIQEALLVWMMESVIRVPKARILEVYLNIIEFAPGVFGIHDAAVHYFGKRPDELTLAECAWLVTIVPGPKRHHHHYMRGEMNASTFDRIKRYMKVMLIRERITQEEYDAAILLRPQFYRVEPNQRALRPVAAAPSASDVLEELFPDLFDATPSQRIPSPGASGTPAPGTTTPGVIPAPDRGNRPLGTLRPPPRANPDPPPTLRLP